MRGSRSSKSNRNSIKVHEMLEVGMKTYYNENKPKFGHKHYRVRDTMLKDEYYKIHSHAINKKDTKDSFFESVIKKSNCAPAAYYKHNSPYDWSDNFKNRGKIMKTEKITFTAEVIQENKRRPKPGAGLYDHKEYLGKGGSTNAKGTLPLGEKFCGFIDEAKWQSSNTAAQKSGISHVVADVRPRAAVMWK